MAPGFNNRAETYRAHRRHSEALHSKSGYSDQLVLVTVRSCTQSGTEFNREVSIPILPGRDRARILGIWNSECTTCACVGWGSIVSGLGSMLFTAPHFGATCRLILPSVAILAHALSCLACPSLVHSFLPCPINDQKRPREEVANHQPGGCAAVATWHPACPLE